MKYKLTLSERVLPEYRATWQKPENLPRQIEIHDHHIAVGNILSVVVNVDPDDSYVIHKELIYKSKEVADSIFAELEAEGLLLQRPEGIETYDVVGVEIPD
jgi:hypothetical protein